MQKFERVASAPRSQIPGLSDVDILLYPDPITSSTAVLEFYLSNIVENELSSVIKQISKVVKTNTGCTHGAVGFADF